MTLVCVQHKDRDFLCTIKKSIGITTRKKRLVAGGVKLRLIFSLRWDSG